jgi:hypothetical protein
VNGQRLTVTPSDGLDPDGASVRVTGSGYDTSLGVYVALCVDQGPTAAPSPCVGGVDLEGSGSSSAWISSTPPPYAVDLATPYGPGGTFDVTLNVTASDEFVDCLAEGTRCVIATRADHTASADRSADVRVPVSFRGQAPAPPPVDPRPSLSLDATSVRAGDPLTVTGSGFLAGEQVQVWLLSDPVLLGVAVADQDGSVSERVTIPAATPPGVHHVELRGLTSGRTVRSGELTVLAADPGPGPDAAPAALVSPAAAPAGAPAGTALALTGGGLGAAALGAVLLGLGLALLSTTRRGGARP